MLADEGSYASMGEAELVEHVEVVRLSYAVEYEHRETRYGAREQYVFLKDEQSRPTADDRFALLQLEGIHRVLLLERQTAGRWVISIDLNANGLFSEDERFSLQAADETLRLAAVAEHPFRIEIDVRNQGAPGDRLRIFRTVHREGTVELLGRRYRFGLWSGGGGFEAADTRLNIDLDGKEEWFVRNRGAIWIAGQPYGFESDGSGTVVRFFELGLDSQQKPPLQRGTQAPTFNGTTLRGELFDLSSTRGEWVLLYFWGRWCEPCVADTDAWVELHGAYASRGFRIVSVSVGDEPEALMEYVEQKQIPWIVIGEDWNAELSRLYRVGRFPTSFLLDPDGTIVEHGLSPASLRTLLDDRLVVDDPSR